MKLLIQQANIITPNLTEMFLLLGKPYHPDVSEDEMKKWLLELSDLGPEIVVVTSVPDKTSSKKFSVIAYNSNDSRFWKVPIDYIPADFPGTGDCFTSVLTGSLMQGDSLPIALDGPFILYPMVLGQPMATITTPTMGFCWNGCSTG